MSPEVLLKIVRVGTANSNRGEFLTEWPLMSLDDPIYFVDRVFGNTRAGGTAGEISHETVAPNYATEMLEEAGAAIASNTGTTTLGQTPLAGTISVIFNKQTVAKDDGNGKLIAYFGSTFLNTSGTNTVNYNSKEVVLTTTAASYAAGAYSIEYSWNSEDPNNEDQYNEMEIKLRKERFNARPQPLGYSYSKMVELQLLGSGIGDAEEILINAVSDQHALRRDYKGIQLLRRVASQNAGKSFDADFAAAGEDNDYNHAQRISSTIDLISGEIYDDIQRGSVNKIVCGTQSATYFRKHKLWKTDTSQNRTGGSYFAGHLDDIEVYVTPDGSSSGSISKNEALLTYKNPEEDGDVGIAYGVLTELTAGLDYPNFYKRGNVASVEDSMVINPKLVRLLTINNIQ